MKKIFLTLLVCLVASAGFGAVSNLSDADNDFAFALLGQIASAQPGQNVFISPYSAFVALQMLANGAAGETRTEIQHVLRTGDIPPWVLNEQFQMLKPSQSQSNVDLDLANSIWVNKGFKLRPAFISTNEALFQAKLASVDFQTPAAADTINDWAKQNTKGKITDIVSFPFPPATQVVLANAIYFKGEWADPFDTNLTRPRDFHLSDGAVKQPPMISKHGKFQYEESDDFQAVALPYAGGQLQMILFLPATNSSPKELLAEFGEQSFNFAHLRAHPGREGTVTFPKFKLNYSVMLNDALKAMGMRQAFVEGSADFSRIAYGQLFVSEVLQKSYVDVNEKGTEAAATTIIAVSNSLEMKPPPPFEMVINRPFLFVIADNSTGMILFTGIVNDPTAD